MQQIHGKESTQKYNLEIELVHKIVKARLSPHRGTLALLFTKYRSLGNHDKMIKLYGHLSNCKNCIILIKLCCLLDFKNQQHIFLFDSKNQQHKSLLDSKVQQQLMLLVLRVQQKHMLLVLRVQQKLMLLVLRVQQTAEFELNLIILTILIINTCNTCKILTSQH